MSRLSSAGAVGACLQPDATQVMVWLCPPGQPLAHLIPLPAERAREVATQLYDAAHLVEQLKGA
ncbi:hypothetical protein IDM40_00405 [Nocardiopsis sp. HNM0947]|uniref:Uncharacterized protein n=1 Tax=Nocardiopsis coralli TaxID=2772213 RepID=A0ABR9P000_9ACTN|nr:hypothetical protein [Nocardiopsis coralli]MBE2997166.1 hypothetical protein [Nocardiopsis coralli]